jgi:drug/metabolite transporter (DMT)-like permease
LTSRREYALGVFYLVLVALCWGFVASTVKRLTERVDPYTISFFRVFLASAVFALLLWRQGWRGLPWLLPWTLAGVAGRAGNYLLYNAGLTDMPSNAVTILAPVQAVGTVLLARWFLSERVRHKWLGILLSVAGLLLIWWSGRGWETLLDPRYTLGNTLFVLAGLASALQFTAQKALSARFSGVQILLPVFVLSSVVTAPVALTVGGLGSTYPRVDWALLLFLGFVLTGGSFYFLGQGYKRCDASTAVVITNTSTFLTLLWSWLLLHEHVSVAMIAGAVLGVVGAIIAVRADHNEAAQLQREATVQQFPSGGE